MKPLDKIILSKKELLGMHLEDIAECHPASITENTRFPIKLEVEYEYEDHEVYPIIIRKDGEYYRFEIAYNLPYQHYIYKDIEAERVALISYMSKTFIPASSTQKLFEDAK